MVLVAHSSGGFVVTEAGDHPDVRHIVYMDAILPDAGEEITKFMGKVDPSFASTFRMKGEFVWFDADALTTHLTDRGWTVDDAREFAGAFRRQRISGTVTEPATAAWRTTASTFIRATDSEMDRDVQDLCASRAERVVEVSGDHFPNWRRPDEIAEIIKAIVDELTT
jgi:pimeloyl-ACP methyl ester carboxylesterase